MEHLHEGGFMNVEARLEFRFQVGKFEGQFTRIREYAEAVKWITYRTLRNHNGAKIAEVLSADRH